MFLISIFSTLLWASHLLQYGDTFQVPLSATKTSPTTTRASQQYLVTASWTIPTRISSVPWRLSATDDDSDETAEGLSSTKKRRKRKRKETTNEEDDDASLSSSKTKPSGTPVVELKPRDDTPVQLQIKNVKEIVGGGGSSVSSSTKTVSRSPSLTSTEASSDASPMNAQQRSSSMGNGKVDDGLGDSLEQLLEDARRMKEQDGKGSGVGGMLLDEEGTGLKEAIRNILSTIVTADFFVVCGFLVWFLAGIAWRAVFNDDSVQIAFNNNFETLVQPALGILMIAAVAGNFFKEDEDTNMMV
jgi:hypothetical protein